MTPIFYSNEDENLPVKPRIAASVRKCKLMSNSVVELCQRFYNRYYEDETCMKNRKHIQVNFPEICPAKTDQTVTTVSRRFVIMLVKGMFPQSIRMPERHRQTLHLLGTIQQL
jgi:hypothetical protein